MDPVQAVEAGAEILQGVLGPHGFSYSFVGHGKGSGGPFAVGEFTNGDRSLQYHYRWHLGIVVFGKSELRVGIECYFRHLGTWDTCRFLRSQQGQLCQFHDLAHDIEECCSDFMTGSAKELIAAAEKASIEGAKRQHQLMIGAVGDLRAREEAAAYFREKNWKRVIQCYSDLKYTEDLSVSEQMKLSYAIRKSQEE